MKRVKPVENEIYHIFNRGVEKRQVFMDESDYFRFIHDLWEFNDWAPAPNMFYRKRTLTISEVGPRKSEREPLVDILAFALMPNHYHLMVQQLVDGGITEFMRKIGTGYTIYFNNKYKRVGYLFGGKYKIEHVKEHAHFIHLPYYIHSNPLDLKSPEWREKRISNQKEAIKFLEEYRWSSHMDYLGIKNFPSVIKKDYLLKIFGSEKGYKKKYEKWLDDQSEESVVGVGRYIDIKLD